MRFNHGSLQNCLIDSVPNKVDPKIGDAATIICWTDSHAATVSAVRRTASGKLVVTVTQDIATRVDKNGLSESQEYTYTTNPNGRTTVYTERKDGVLREKQGSNTLALGYRREYYDFCF